MKMNYFATALISSLLLAGCGKPLLENNKPLPRVKVIQLGDKLSHQDDRAYLPAIASAADRSQLAFRVSGEVSVLNVNEGDLVAKGDVIAEIDPTDFQLTVDNAQAAYNVANSQYERSAQLVKKGLLAQSQFDELAAQRKRAKAELDLAKLRLTFTKLRAPMDGIISRINVEQFENIRAGQQIVNIHNANEVDIVAQIADQIFINRKEFDKEAVEVVVRVASGDEYIAKLKEYTTEQDPATATYTITLTMPMPDNQLILDGMAVEIYADKSDVALDSVSSIVIPIESITNPDGEALDRENKFVWVLNDDNTVTRIKVETGRIAFDSIQVLSGLQPGQKLVVAGLARLSEGAEVMPIEQEAQ
ncbi:efflux RND transporter periplasmic adaptor subunit [Vibrio sp. HN007]|uniref:efflux RND transporter periplasmic adaptor subunit n=1 Tax=Vibrio iocasae TaxID=3098914 RepID=UPI0035D4A8FD